MGIIDNIVMVTDVPEEPEIIEGTKRRRDYVISRYIESGICTLEELEEANPRLMDDITRVDMHLRVYLPRKYDKIKYINSTPIYLCPFFDDYNMENFKRKVECKIKWAKELANQ